MPYVIRNCPACVISPSVCSEWHIKQGGEAKGCSDINDCLLKRIVEKCRNEVILADFNGLEGVYRRGLATEILKFIDIEEVE